MSATTARRRLRFTPPRLPPGVVRWAAGIAALLLVLAPTYLFWLRDASIVAVDDVTITGLTSDDADSIRSALEAEARHMTTLHVREERLERVVAGYPVVQGLEVGTDFPHGMTIHVVEHRAVAFAPSGEGRVPIAADGSVLAGLPVKGSLPMVEVHGPLPPERIEDPGALALLQVAGAAPAELAAKAEEVTRDAERGIVVPLEDGPELVFGSAAEARHKWTAAARVLADDASAGAAYVDVRIAERPTAGGFSGVE